MLEAENMNPKESVNKGQNSTVFNDLFKDGDPNSIFIKAGIKTVADETMKLFGEVNIFDTQQANQVSPRFADDAAFNAAEYIIQQIKDTSALDGAAAASAQQDIDGEIKGLSTLPDSMFNFNQFYVGLEMNISDQSAAPALSKLDKNNVIRDELDKDYLDKQGSNKADDIHKSVNAIVAQVVALSQEPMCPTDNALAPIYEAAKEDMSKLTRAEQYVYAFNLSYELQSRTNLDPLLDTPTSKIGKFLYFGIFDVKPTDYESPVQSTFGYDTSTLNEQTIKDVMKLLDQQKPPEPLEPSDVK